MSNIFKLNAHKKCIGQFNFDPLLYYNQNGIEQHSFQIVTPGKYTIRYVSGAIISFNTKTINTFLPSTTSLIDENHLYWNRYYETSAVALGQYDITYFPTSSILFGCFQCQFGTLPGFTKEGYKTKALAQIMNSKYYRNKNKTYNFTDELTFTIQSPTQLVFWYTDVAQQSVQGQITYQIDYNIDDDDEIYYANDISVLAVNKSDKVKLSYENYMYNKHKSNIINQALRNPAEAWIQNLKLTTIVENINTYNTIGYEDAYLKGNFKYTDTLNYEYKYSQKYKWELYKNIISQYQLIGKFNAQSENLLLYPGTYSIFIAHSQYHIFNQYILNLEESDSVYKQYWPFISKDLVWKSVYTFSIQKIGLLEFNKLFIKDSCSIYLYKGVIDLNNLSNYINTIKQHNTFITSPDKKLIETYYNKDYISIIQEYTEFNYRYYLDITNYLDNQQMFLIYTSNNVRNFTSIGPFDTFNETSGIIPKYFNIDSSTLSCQEISSNINTINREYQITYSVTNDIKGETDVTKL